MHEKEYFELCQTASTVPFQIIDSYQQFLNHFGIEKQAFYEWGISATIFPPVTEVEKEWDSLKKRVFNNETVYIRGYGRDARGTQLYQDLYKELFANQSVVKDPTNNANPHKLIQTLTGLKRNKDIINYQVSHIWGHTKNILLFEAPWNICFTPKMIDPFTGHETQGTWPIEYQTLFLSKAYDLYSPFVEDYNRLLRELHIEDRVQAYLHSLRNTVAEKELLQFSKDVAIELAPIVPIE